MKCFLPALIALASLTQPAAAENNTLTLSGEWRFQLDADHAGVEQKWHSRKLNDMIALPGTTDEARKGIFQDERPVDRLSRLWFWKGAAWYQREVTIPKSWKGKRITLFLERTKHSRLWVNDTFISWHDSLSAPHIFDVTGALTPGTHPLTLLIDNSKLPPVGPSHAVDERTQTNWNGIVGRIELRATDPVWIEDVQVHPDAANHQARVVATLGNITGKPALGTLAVTGRSRNVKTPAALAAQTVDVVVAAGKSTIEFIYQPGTDAPLWDEFNPALLELDLKLTAASFTDDHRVTFGMRDFTRAGNRLLINDRPVFLRGRVDCANYPLTGYAPMDRASWRRILQIQKDWELNHISFHSWCPPAAAFEVADELGFYLQVELPNKRSAFNTTDEANAAIHNYDFLDVNTSNAEVSLFDYGKREGEKTQAHLKNGGRVLLLPKLGNLPIIVPGSFMTDYWSPMFAQGDRKRGETPPPGTMGILCDPNHPAFAAFPTEFHSNWQWWHLVKSGRPIVLDDTPHDYRPILQVIDNFDRNHKFGLIFETRVGKGSMLVCSINLPALQDKPEARQLLHSLQQYAASPDFAPKHELDPAILN